MKIIIIGKSNCPWCSKALKRVLDTPYEVEYINLDENDTAKRIMKLHGHSKVPQCFYQAHDEHTPVHIGGYDVLDRFLTPSEK